MRLPLHSMTMVISFVLAAATAARARSDEPRKPAPDQTSIAKDARNAIARGLDFVQKDAAKWRTERKCATCHHGTMTAWVLSDAVRLGYDIKPETLTETAKWAKERLDKIDLPRDKRPGWNMVNTPALYLSAMDLTVPQQNAVSADELKRIAGHLVRHQEADGSWAWSLAPAQNRPPPVFESDEVATLLALAALRPQLPGDPKEKSDLRDAANKAEQWLAKSKPTDTTQAAAMRLLVKSLAGTPLKNLETEIDQLLHRQNKDGGWGQIKDAASDAYATGQVLYVLGVVGVKNDREEVKRGVAFLVHTQKEGGSWPMKSRAQPGATPFKNPVPITYFGSAWGTLGLMRSVPK